MQPTRQMSQQERAALAVREFKKMLPGLTTFVRVITGKRSMRVEMGSQSGTDGRKVYIRPPMALAESAIHQRAVCDVREGNRLICPACNRLEEIYVVIYHEVSHNVAGSMDEFEDSELRTIAIQSATDHGSLEYQEFIKSAAYSITSRMDKFDVYDYGCRLTDYLLGFVRAIDDYRIDMAAYAARPGVEVMRYNQTEIILDKGLELPDGRVQLWSEAPIEAQIPIAILVGKQGHDISEPRFDSRITELFEIPAIKSLLNEPVPDMKSVLYLSVAFLGELNKLGLYDLPFPEAAPPPPMFGDGEPDDTQDSGGDSEDDNEESENAGTGRGTGNGSSNNSDPDDSEPDSDDSNSDDSGEGDSSTSDDSTGDESDGQENGQGSDADDAGDAEDSGEESGAAGTESGNNSVETGESSSSSDNEDQHGSPSTGVNGSSGDHAGGGESSIPDDRDEPAEDSEGNSTVDPRSQGDDDDSEEEDFQGDSGSAAEITGSTDKVPDFSDVDHASAEEIKAAMEQASGHSNAEVIIGAPHSHGHDDDDDDPYDPDPYRPEDPMEKAVIKALVFDDANTTVVGLVVHEGGKGGRWSSRSKTRRVYEFSPIDRSLLSPSILHARRIFSDSKLDKTVPNLKKGKLATAKLGTRAWNKDDDRLFKRKIRAEGIDDELLIAMDLSGSTGHRWNRLIKEAAHAMADVAASVGVKFTICGHTTNAAWNTGEFTQVIYTVKKVNEPWGPDQKNSMARLGAMEGSLDGHNFEYYRKVLQRSQARRKTLIYFTDGQIPETNHVEEVEIIARELKLYKQLGFGILVVAFGTEGPKNYGLDTIRIDSSRDILTVVRELDSRLTH